MSFSTAVRGVESGMKAEMKIWDHPQALWSVGQVPQPFPEFILQSKQCPPKGAHHKGLEKPETLWNCIRALQEPSVTGLVLQTNSSLWRCSVAHGSHRNWCCLLTSLREFQGVSGEAQCCRGELGLCCSSSWAWICCQIQCWSFAVFLTGPFTLDSRLI